MEANNTDNENNKPSYKWYMEYNEGLEYERENINLDEKSDIVKILKPKEDKSTDRLLTDRLLIDAKFPKGYIFSIAEKNK